MYQGLQPPPGGKGISRSTSQGKPGIHATLQQATLPTPIDSCPTGRDKQAEEKGGEIVIVSEVRAPSKAQPCRRGSGTACQGARCRDKRKKEITQVPRACLLQAAQAPQYRTSIGGDHRANWKPPSSAQPQLRAVQLPNTKLGGWGLLSPPSPQLSQYGTSKKSAAYISTQNT